MSLTVNNEKDTLRTDFENKTESTNSRQSKGEDPYCGKAKKKQLQKEKLQYRQDASQIK